MGSGAELIDRCIERSRLVSCVPAGAFVFVGCTQVTCRAALHRPAPRSRRPPHGVAASDKRTRITHALSETINVIPFKYKYEMSRKSRSHQPVQLTLDSARKSTGRGGWRPNSGRPKGRTKVAHLPREDFPSRIPQHVTLKLVPGLSSLRNERLVGLIRTQIALSHGPEYRIIEFCVQHDHLHFIKEAGGVESLSAGVHDLEIRLARRLNRALGRKGTLFGERYHNRSLSSPREVRNALRYVLNNERHHADKRGQTLPANWLDPFSSAPWFEGWAAPVETSTLPAKVLALPRPTMKPSVWLLTTGWKKHGLIQFDEVPGRRRGKARQR